METCDGAKLHIFLLAGFRVERNGQPISDSAWERPAAKTLVKLLALERTHRLHRDQILELLWPDDDPANALPRLRKALTWARNALDPGRVRWERSAYIRTDGELVSLDGELVTVDCDRFERRAAAALESGKLSTLEDALRLYTGELLPEDRYADWAADRREVLASLRGELVLTLAGELELDGRYVAAARQLETLLQDDPTREEIHRNIMRLFLAAGRPQRALDQFEKLHAVLDADVGEPPDAESLVLRDEADARMQMTLADNVGTPPPSPSVRKPGTVPLIGRQRLITMLNDALSDVGAGNGTAVVISGEAGVGKTRLVAELVDHAAAGEIPVLWGQGYQEDGAVAYGPLIEAIERYLAGKNVAEIAHLAGRFPELATLLPSLGALRSDGLPDRPVNPAIAVTEQGRLFAGLARFLSELAGDKPMILVLDDLHAADIATLELVNHLLRVSARRPLLILGTYRREDTPSGSPLRHILVGAQRAGLVRSVGLLRLARDESDRLVAALLEGGDVSEAAMDHIWDLSLGNPLMARELVQTMLAEGTLQLDEGNWKLANKDRVVVPHTIRDIVQARLARCGPDATAALALASVNGMETSYELLRRAGTLEAERLLDAIDAALAARLVEERGDRYVFQHPLVRQAILDSISAPRRRHLHGSLAVAIEQTWPDDVEVLAYHYDRSDAADQAIAYLERAGDRAAAIYANAAAESYYQRLIERLDALGRAVDAARVRAKLGDVLARVARYDDALALLEQALTVQRAVGDWPRVGDLAGPICYVHSTCGSLVEGMGRVEEFLDLLGDRGLPGVVARLRVAQGSMFFDLGQYESSARVLDQAATEARRIDDQSILALAEVNRGLAVASVGQAEEGLGILQAGVALAREIEDYDSLSLGLLLAATGMFLAGYIEPALPVLDETIAVSERLGDPVRVGMAPSYRGIVEYMLGRWDGALSDLTLGLESMQRVTTRFSPFPLVWLADLQTARGEWEEAERYGRAAVGYAGDVNLLGLRQAQRVLAHLDVLLDRPAAAIARLEPLLDRQGAEEQAVTAFLPELAAAYLAAGKIDTAADTAQQAVDRSRVGFRSYLPSALRVLGMVRTEQRRFDDAGTALDESIAVAGSIACPYDEARAHHARAELAIAQKLPSIARDHLERALTLYRALGARRGTARAEQAVADLTAASA